MLRKFFYRLNIPLLVTIVFGLLAVIVLRIFNKNIEKLEDKINSRKSEKPMIP